jgi:hypothetical protein
MVGSTTALVPVDERVRAKRAALARHPLLAGCSALTVRRLAAVADEVRVTAGDVVVEQGRHGLWFFLIESGRAEVVRDGRPAGHLGPGQHFGEAAVLRQVPQPATVRAVSDMTLYVVGCQRLVPLVRDTRALRRRLGDVVPAPHRVRPRSSATDPMWRARDRRDDHLLQSEPVRPRTGRRWAVGACVAVAAVAAALWHPPLAVVAPGRPFDVADDITITGVPTTRIHGRYLVPTVQVTHPTLLGLGRALLHPNRRVVALEDVFPAGSSRETLRREGEAAFRRSQLLGAAAGAQAAGLPVRVTGPADDPRVDLPFAVRFRARAVGGPSAGLAYALAVEDILDGADRANGRTIVATGDVTPSGAVWPVGYVAQKAAVAKAARGSLLLVPDVEVTDAWGKGIVVDGVGSVAEALATLH